MPRISSDLLDCVVYLYSSEQDANDGEKTGGSGFLFPLSYNEDCPVKGIHVYAVSNAHVVNTAPVIRVNRLDGRLLIIDPGADAWISHPEGVDLAVCPLSLDDLAGSFFLHTPAYHLRPKPETPWEDIHGQILGREVLMIGRFVDLDGGSRRNVPALRFGNVAALPVEPIIHPDSDVPQESFLVETHSIPGYSGSPVFVLPDPWDQVRTDPLKEKFKKWKIFLGAPYSSKTIRSPQRDLTLLGVYWCYFTEPPNPSMAGVVPWWKLWELFDSPKLSAMRKTAEDKAKKKMLDAD